MGSTQAQSDSITRNSADWQEVHCFCDVEAEFPGGTYYLKKYLINQFAHLSGKLDQIDSRSSYKIYVYFMVTDEGDVESVRVRNLDDPVAEEWIEHVMEWMPGWSPAEHGCDHIATRVRISIELVVGDPRYFD
ncbi:MAG: hypothetical protein DCO96_11850 [Fluviicola sp. XM-24bin1]|nr:MAG: hypothetical protein DCO96_11850 [Fluviicola sp. XM-24bin1]